MTRRICRIRVSHLALSIALAMNFLVMPFAMATPPVRIAVVPGGGSGQEQEVVDRISGQLQNTADVELSTVNPDWYVVCNIKEMVDQASGSIRYNGTVLIKTSDGQVINTVAVQKYNQDFSLQPGAPLNKKLVDNAVQDVITGMTDRAMGPIQQAIETEIETRNRMIEAMQAADSDNYDKGISLLSPITPETTHYKKVRSMLAMLQMEQDALQRVNSAAAMAKQGKYSQAIGTLAGVDPKSKRKKLAVSRAATYRAAMAHH